MQTEALTAMLALNLEPVAPGRRVRRYALGIAVGGVVALLLVGGMLHVNPGLPHEASQWMLWVREIYCAALGVLSVLALAHLARPGDRLGLWPACMAAIVVMMWILGAAVLVFAGPQNRAHLLLGTTSSVCALQIALLAAPLFIALVTNLRWTGATAGFAAGSLVGYVNPHEYWDRARPTAAALVRIYKSRN